MDGYIKMEGNMKMNIVIDGIDEAMDRRTDMSRTSYIHTYIHTSLISISYTFDNSHIFAVGYVQSALIGEVRTPRHRHQMRSKVYNQILTTYSFTQSLLCSDLCLMIQMMMADDRCDIV